MQRVNIGIIGGTGSMGRWFADFFSRAGHRVFVSGRRSGPDFSTLADTCEVVVLSVPLDAAVDLAKKIGPLLGPEQLLIDFCSLKSRIVAAMAGSSASQVVGTHPLFGPSADRLKGRNVIVCPVRGETWLWWLEDLFRREGGVVTRMDPESHDRSMALVQGLTHLITACVGETLRKMELSPRALLDTSTPIFRFVLDLVGRLHAQESGLYRNLIGMNPYLPEVLEIFREALAEGEAALVSGAGGESFLEKTREFLDGFSEIGLAESSRVLNLLYEEEIQDSRFKVQG